MKTKIARDIVRVTSWFLDQAYKSYCDEFRWREYWYAKIGKWWQRCTWWLARRLDRKAMVEEMVNACWWG